MHRRFCKLVIVSGLPKRNRNGTKKLDSFYEQFLFCLLGKVNVGDIVTLCGNVALLNEDEGLFSVQNPPENVREPATHRLEDTEPFRCRMIRWGLGAEVLIKFQIPIFSGLQYLIS